MSRRLQQITVNEFVCDTFQTLVCHGNLCQHHRIEPSWPGLPPTTIGQPPIDDATTAHRRTARSVPANGRRWLANGTVHELVVNGMVHLVSTVRRHSGGRSGPRSVPNATVAINTTTTIADARQSALVARKINTDKYWKKYKQLVKQRTQLHGNGNGGAAASASVHATANKSAAVHGHGHGHGHVSVNGNDDDDDDGGGGSDDDDGSDSDDVDYHNSRRGGDAKTVSDFTLNWPIIRTAGLFSVAYMVFLVCAVQFLLDTESAVFTVAVVSLALPVAGIFWSLFELKSTDEHIGELCGDTGCNVRSDPLGFFCLLRFGVFASPYSDNSVGA